MAVDRVKDAIGKCDTGLIAGLSQQIIDEMNLVIPGVLVDFTDLNVNAGGLAVNPYLQAAAKEALRGAIRARGRRMRVNSAYRTVAQQFILRAQFENSQQCGITRAAQPGRSNHEDGLALDLADHAGWRPFLEARGWQWLGPTDPPHFSFMGGGVRGDVGSIGVRAFQRLWNRHNSSDLITADGVFGTQTGLRIANSPAMGLGVRRVLRLTAPPLTGDDVRQVQEALTGAGLPVAVDGVFGSVTEASIRQFQEREGLAIDGIVGPSTRRALGLFR